MSALRNFLLFVAVTLFAFPLSGAEAQERRWIQVEARFEAALARERAAAFTALFPETWGFRLPSGWFAIVLGPYGAEEARDRLAGLKLSGQIPGDAYLTDGREFRDQFWPEGGRAAAVPGDGLSISREIPGDLAAGEGFSDDLAPVEAPPEPVTLPAEPVAQPALPAESLAEARAGEAALSEDEKKQLQTALMWFGFYEGGIDGAFGPGTRNAMAAWQQAVGAGPTGVLTAAERADLTRRHQNEITAFGFALVEEPESGIDVTLPLALVEFDRYEPPFVHFRAREGSDLAVTLISQPGDTAGLAGIYDLLGQLQALPEGAERQLGERSFTIRGADDARVMRAEAALDKGLIKGWILTGLPENAARDQRVAERIAASFRAVGDTALDPGLVPLDEAVRRGLVAGLEVERPKLSRSGFYISAAGHVLTSSAAVAECGRITLDHRTAARLVAGDGARGLALLEPQSPLAPRAFGRIAPALPAAGGAVVMPGYPWEGRLSAPVLSHGSFEEKGGLDGEAGLIRLAASLRSGNAGGPVLDPAGTVIGMLSEPARGGPLLPGGVAFAADSAALLEFVTAAGVAVQSPAGGSVALAPETLSREAAAMTVLVSCWP